MIFTTTTDGEKTAHNSKARMAYKISRPFEPCQSLHENQFFPPLGKWERIMNKTFL